MQPQEGGSAPVQENPQPTPQPSETPSGPQPQAAVTSTPKTNVMAIVGLILAFIVPILGFILSLVAKSQIKKTGEGGNGLATGGIIVSIVLFFFQALFVLLLIIGSVANVQNNVNSNSSNSSSSSSSTTNTSSYSADENKAVTNSEAFLRAIQASDYSAAYNLMGPELQKQYSGGQTQFQKELENANLKLIKSWEIESATTNGSNDRITVKGTAKFSGSYPNGKIEFGYYKDIDGSIRMNLWYISPSR